LRQAKKTTALKRALSGPTRAAASVVPYQYKATALK